MDKRQNAPGTLQAELTQFVLETFCVFFRWAGRSNEPPMVMQGNYFIHTRFREWVRKSATYYESLMGR